MFETGQKDALEKSLKSLCEEVAKSVKAGAQCIVLTDRFESPSADKVCRAFRVGWWC